MTSVLSFSSGLPAAEDELRMSASLSLKMALLSTLTSTQVLKLTAAGGMTLGASKLKASLVSSLMENCRCLAIDGHIQKLEYM